MTTATITKRLEIDAGHRLLRHEGKCRNVHGHRYAFEVTCAGPLDDVGRVVDFGVIKARVGAWLDENWDHAYIAQMGDAVAGAAHAAGLRVHFVTFPPTAENLAKELYRVASLLLAPTGVRVVRVRCCETPTSVADYPPIEADPDLLAAARNHHCGRCPGQRADPDHHPV